MKELFDTFLSLVKGKPVEVSDPTNPFQCMDLAYSYCDFLQIPRSAIKHLHAYQVFTNPTADTAKYFNIIPVGTAVPEVGWLVIFGQAVGTSGHISVFQTLLGKGFISLDQNWNKVQKAVLVTHNSFNGVIGYLQPKSISSTVVEMITDQTKIPQIVDKNGPMEVQAIRSAITDQQNYIKALLEQIKTLEEKVPTEVDNDFLVKAEAARKALDEFLA